MLTYLLDWLGLLVRWLHVVAGIAWIGASFYFVWLDNHLRPLGPQEPADPLIAGELWAVHGGGFYRARKYRLAPDQLPPTLHWFYWEAYTTWLSGFALLCLLYFVRAEAYLIDPAVMALSRGAAIALAIAFLVVVWVIYDVLCRSPLARRAACLTTALGTLFAAEAWGLCHLFSGRGAYMIFGASLGTVMVANVAMVIIPGQRELVRAKQQSRAVDPAPGARGKQRSVHNTYLTLPVLFVMISNHYAMTYGSRHNWLVLIALSLAGASLRAWFVARHRADEDPSAARATPAVLGLVTIAAVVYALAPAPATVSAAGVAAVDMPAAAPALQTAQVQAILAQRCTPCHAVHPTQAGFAAPPNGLVFERLDQLAPHLPQVRQQLTMHTMPLGNLTRMSEDERALLLTWIGD
jgi:uncharacterized membrane protein